MNNRPLLGQVLTSAMLRQLADDRTLGRGRDGLASPSRRARSPLFLQGG